MPQITWFWDRRDSSTIEKPNLVGLHDRALLAVMVYSFARVSIHDARGLAAAFGQAQVLAVGLRSSRVNASSLSIAFQSWR
jgi:hypothetical protein